jgi:hypothetical protein
MLERPDVDRILVYEKTAHLMTSSPTFDQDVQSIRTALTEHGATTVHEDNSGIIPAREWSLAIRVTPEQFDAPLVEQLRHIGHLRSIRIVQRDRSAEFRQLHAQRQSLKKYLDSVQKIRAVKMPSVEEHLQVEQRIQEIEKDLDARTARFGDWLGKESYYQINLTLEESSPGSLLDPTRSLPTRMVRAVLWALPWWCAILVCIGVIPLWYLSLKTLGSREDRPA